MRKGERWGGGVGGQSSNEGASLLGRSGDILPGEFLKIVCLKTYLRVNERG